jgi:hypothetical protein
LKKFYNVCDSLHGGITFETNRLKAKRNNIDIELVTTKNNNFFYSSSPIYMYSGASDFCHLQLILPGSPTGFEIRIFLSLRPILCYVMSVSRMLKKIGQTAWQNWLDSKNQTNFGCFV